MADVRMKGFQKRARLEEVDALIRDRVRPLGVERVPFSRACGRVLAEDVLADRDVPPHPRSAMDGYAVRAKDLPGLLAVVGEVKAADIFDGTVGRGDAVRIMTGGRIPEGADAVVMVEDCTVDGASVRIESAPAPGQHVFQTGEDFTLGRPVLTKGKRIRPQDLSMLATVGALEVKVVRKPRVRIVPSGTELVRVGVKATGPEVIESNSFLLEALAIRDGAEPVLYPIVTDDEAALEHVMTEPGVDVVIITGGSSVGKEDFAPVVLSRIGELPIHGVAVRPGSPSGIGFVGGTIVILAPGYPGAAFVAWDLIARPVVQRLSGVSPTWPYRTVRGRLAQAVKKPTSRAELKRVTVHASSEGLPLVTPMAGGAAMLSTMCDANGFLFLAQDHEGHEAEDEVEVHLY